MARLARKEHNVKKFSINIIHDTTFCIIMIRAHNLQGLPRLVSYTCKAEMHGDSITFYQNGKHRSMRNIHNAPIASADKIHQSSMRKAFVEI